MEPGKFYMDVFVWLVNCQDKQDKFVECYKFFEGKTTEKKTLKSFIDGISLLYKSDEGKKFIIDLYNNIKSK